MNGPPTWTQDAAALDQTVRAAYFRERQSKVQSEEEAKALFAQYRAGLITVGKAIALQQCRDFGETWSSRVLEEMEKQDRLPIEISRQFVASCFDSRVFESFGRIAVSNPARNHHAGRENKKWRLRVPDQ